VIYKSCAFEKERKKEAVANPLTLLPFRCCAVPLGKPFWKM